MGDESRNLSIGLFVFAMLIFAPWILLGDTFLVDSSIDSIDINPGDAVCLDASGECTLRAAIVESNALPGTDTVRLPAATYQLTIPGNGEDASLQGDLDITEALTLESVVPGDALNTIIEQTTGGGVIHIPTNQLVLISGVTITGAMGTGEGGGVTSVVLGTVQILDSIIRDNDTGGSGGGGVAQEIIQPVSAPGILFVGNSIIAGNMAGGVPFDCAGGDLNSNGNNLVQTTANCVLGGVGDIVGDPLLLALAVDTGLTATHLPTIGSPVVDAGNPSLPGSGGDACEASEQRGFDRPIDGDLDTIDVCDIGAVELFAVLIFGQAPASFESGDLGDWVVFPAP